MLYEIYPLYLRKSFYDKHMKKKYINFDRIGCLLVKSDLEREARMMDKKVKARKKRKSIAKDRDFSKNRVSKKKHLTSKKICRFYEKR